MSQTENQFQKQFKTVITARHAWRKFSPTPVSQTIINDIVNCSLASPSSFGLEPWKLLVISNQAIKTELLPYCYNQEQVTGCSHLIILLSLKGKMFEANASWITNRLKTLRNLKTDEEYQHFYQTRFLKYMSQIANWDEWSIRQTYILLEAILVAATVYGLGSSPMEGIKTQEIVTYLETKELIDADEVGMYNCPVVVALGYKDENYQIRKRYSRSCFETAKYIK